VGGAEALGFSGHAGCVIIGGRTSTLETDSQAVDTSRATSSSGATRCGVSNTAANSHAVILQTQNTA